MTFEQYLQDKHAAQYQTISDYPKYQACKNGTIWSLDYNHTKKKKQLRTYPDKDGYRYVVLRINGNKYVKRVHVLILMTFLEKPSTIHQCNHKNGIRNDNRVENLEWVTPSENCLHAFRVNGRVISDKCKTFNSIRMKKMNKIRWETKPTHCKRGHKYNEPNSDGKILCKECQKIHKKTYRGKLYAKANI